MTRDDINYKHYKEIEDLIEYAETEWMCTDATVAALKWAKMCIGAYPQLRWERDVALEQLNEIGISLGQKMDSIKEAIRKMKDGE